MIRSTTDEMLAARHDPEPYVNEGGVRWSVRVNSHLTFAPRVECIPSRDPEPWNCGSYRVDYEQGLELALNGAGPEWDPRPEFARPEPNPILASLREYMKTESGVEWGLAFWAQNWLDNTEPGMGMVTHWFNHGHTLQDVADARPVLARIVAVFS